MLGLSSKESCFLWGPRQCGKSTLLRHLFPEARFYDLLQSDLYQRLLLQPSALREECAAAGLTGDNQRDPIIIDEAQRLPALFSEVHWLIENRRLRFILCGSSARKVRREHGNLLGGRAVRYELFPLVYPEIPDFDLVRALNHGLLPRHYLSESPGRLLQSYVGDYLREEVAAESFARNIPAFGRFLEVAALSNGEMVNSSNIAAECGVSAPTVREYYQILVDTLAGRFVPAWTRRMKRRVIQAPRFYFFDVGVVAFLARRGRVVPGSELFGRAFEHFIHGELCAYASYSEKFFPISYVRTASGLEVDFVLGDAEVLLEVKSAVATRPRHLHGLRSVRDELGARRAIVVSLDPAPRRTEDGVEIMPWRAFLDTLWAGGII